MPARMFNLENGSTNSSPTSVPRTRTAPPREPREECMRLSKTSLAERRAVRAKPWNLPLEQTPSTSMSMAPPPASRKESSSFEMPRDPEIVDLESTTTWPRRATTPKEIRSGSVHSPGIVSRQSGRQSEISLGILDYYMRDPSPTMVSPAPASTPTIKPLAEPFDFGVVPGTPTPLPARSAMHSQTRAGAERKQLPAVPLSRREPSGGKAYSLFPAAAVQQQRQKFAPSAQQQQQHVPSTPTIESLPLYSTPPSDHASSPSSPPNTQTPHRTYRPRKESISRYSTTIARTRTDSILAPSSFPREGPSILPSRILSGGDGNSSASGGGGRRTPSSSSSFFSSSSSAATLVRGASSDPRGGTAITTITTKKYNSKSRSSGSSRWSDENLTSPSSSLASSLSPSAATPVYPPRRECRTFFTGQQQQLTLLKSNEIRRYPDCFFEDDDDDDENDDDYDDGEAVPLTRRKKTPFASWMMTKKEKKKKNREEEIVGGSCSLESKRSDGGDDDDDERGMVMAEEWKGVFREMFCGCGGERRMRRRRR